MKECKRCGQSKPLDMFSPNKRSRDGRHSYCKTCRSEYANAYNKRKRKYSERIKAPDREDADALLRHLCEAHYVGMAWDAWPRPLTEQLLDLKVRNWRYPASAGQLTWRV